jgi:hypothetical protein
LRRLHAHLIADPTYAADAHITQGYWGVIKELMPAPEVKSGDMTRRMS